jgi:chaperonin GroEL
MGVRLVREAASQTNDVAGDGTTTATVLTCALATLGQKYINSGYSSVDLKNGMDRAVAFVVEEMKKAEADTTLKKSALDISLALDKAYTEMETWMPKLGEAADMKDSEDKVKALTTLKTEGMQLKELTLDAKKKADEFLK